MPEVIKKPKCESIAASFMMQVLMLNSMYEWQTTVRPMAVHSRKNGSSKVAPSLEPRNKDLEDWRGQRESFKGSMDLYLSSG
jgi:hypothetical protein